MTTPFDDAIASTKASIAAVEATAEPLRNLLRQQEDQRRRYMTKTFIETSGITRADVWHSDDMGDGNAPYFTTLSQFAAWIGTQSTQLPFTEWNGHIYHTACVMPGGGGGRNCIEGMKWDDVPVGAAK